MTKSTIKPRIGLNDRDITKLNALHDRLLSFMGSRHQEYFIIKTELHEITCKIRLINDCFKNSVIIDPGVDND